MKKIFLWMPAAILFSSLMMASCVGFADSAIGVEDNPTEPTKKPETASAKDPGKWWIDESYMDKSVKLSDDFFMYCIGTWWKNTTLDKEHSILYRFYDVKPSFTDRVNSLTDDNYSKYKSRLKWADPNSEAAASAQKLYDDVLKKSGLEAATTPEDVMRAFGKMSAMGVSSCIRLEPFGYNGKVYLYVDVCNESYSESKKSSSDATQSDKKTSFRELFKKHPELMQHLVPVSGKSGTRSIPEKLSFIKYILEGMGIDPEACYTLEDWVTLTDQKKSSVINNKIAYMEEWQKIFTDKEKAVTLLKEMIENIYHLDYCLISQKTMEEVNDKLKNDTQAEGAELSLQKVEKTMEVNYLPYLRSKLVAEQMVPAGLKDEYMNYCKEMIGVFGVRIKTNEWMSEGSKKNALDKLNAMVFNVAYPDHWIKEGLPDFSKSQSLLEDVYIMRTTRQNLLKAIVGKSRLKESFTALAMDNEAWLGLQNAFYDPLFNSMNILPYYILPPNYDPTQSLVINYQMFDTMGHEMTHGFDTSGSQFDKNGNYIPNGIWASEADKAEFDRRTELLVKCYDSYDVLPDEMPGVKADGKTTLGENIADLGGTEIAYQAFLNRLKIDGYTGDNLKLMKQRFFLSLGEEWRSKYGADYVNYIAFGKDNPDGPDVHSMSKERVNGVVANMNSWYEAFDIKDGALYRAPKDRIKIW
ncbi:MAG: M13 family metallopeptidase [Prevotella sp.]|jgi:putative endopeptidase|nr:M13 family metallopeptidase [Prevotella sp.]MBR6827963.1 M13 family metallopeptidase [Prevotella sp.]